MIRRVCAALFKAWLAGSAAATALLIAKSELGALKMLPTFAVLLGAWLIVVGSITLLARNRQLFMLIWVYGASLTSALLSALLFFVLFVYPLMVCIPVGMLVSAFAFHVVVRQSTRDGEGAHAS